MQWLRVLCEIKTERVREREGKERRLKKLWGRNNLNLNLTCAQVDIYKIFQKTFDKAI